MYRRILPLLFSLLLITSIGFSQSNDEGLAFLQLNFLNPGARSLGMGGAFIAVADDATAALANPAGLPLLIKPEVSVEFSSTQYDNEIPWTSGVQTLSIQDDGTNFRSFNFAHSFEPQDFPETVNNLSFASFVYPAVRGKFVLSGFYNEQTKFKRDFETKGFDQCPRGDECLQESIYATRNSLKIKMRNLGISAGIKPSENFSFGVTLSTSALELDSASLRFDTQDDDRSRNQEVIHGDDSQFGFSLGALVIPNSTISFGAVYTNRPEFDVSSSYVAFEPAPLPPGTQLSGTFRESDERFHVPDSYGFGVSVRPINQFSINFDYVRILYSQLNDGYYNAFFSPTFPGFEQSRFFNAEDFAKATLKVEDGSEYRVGGEYLLTAGDYSFAFRAGYWREPFHSVVNTADDSQLEELFVDGQQVNDVNAVPFFSRSLIEDHNHVTFGAGIVLDRFAVDVAYDYSSSFKRFIVSTILYLAK